MRQLALAFVLLGTVGCGSGLPPAKSTADLQKELQAPEADVRREAVAELGKMGPGAEDAIDALFAAVEKDSDAKVRRGAALAIGEVAIEQWQVTERLDKLASTEKDGEVKAALFQAADNIRNARRVTAQ